MFLEAMLFDRVLKQPVQFLRCPTHKYIHYREIRLRETEEQASESTIPAASTRLARPGPRTPHPMHRARPPRSLPDGSRPESRVFADSHLPPRGGGQLRERARSNLPFSPRQPRDPAVPPPRGRGSLLWALDCGGTIRKSAGAVHGPGAARNPPRRGRPRDVGGPGSAGSPGAARELAALGGRNAGRLAPQLRAAEPAPREQPGGAEHRGGSQSPRRGRPDRLPGSRRGAGRGGWPGEGGKGQGRGRGEGEPLCGVASELLPPPPRPPPPFPIHSNKQDGGRYGAALPAAQILGSNRQDVYGQKGTCAPAQPAGAAPHPQKGRRRRADHFLVSGPATYWPRSRRKGFLEEVCGASELANAAPAQHRVTNWGLT